MRELDLPALLSFNGGFVDTAGFLGLQGLFYGPRDRKFRDAGCCAGAGNARRHRQVAGIARIRVGRRFWPASAGYGVGAAGLPALSVLLAAKVCFLLAFFVLAVALGPFPDSDAPPALLTGFAGVAGMAIQNAVQRVHFASIPPTT